MSKCNCNPCTHGLEDYCNGGEKSSIYAEALELIEIIAEAKSADKQLLGFMATCWINNAEKLLAKARGEHE